MAGYTIVYGGGQAASAGYASGGDDVMLILGTGAPKGDAYPQVNAAMGSEFVDCSQGSCYMKKTDDGDDADWAKHKETPVAKFVAAASAPKRKRRASRKKAEVA